MALPDFFEPFEPESSSEVSGDLAVMLTGGGARAAYQVGLLKGLAQNFPNLQFQIITGVSAGAINAIFLAARNGAFPDRVDQLAEVWCELQSHRLFQPNYASLLPFRTALNTVLPRLVLPRHPNGAFH